MKKLQKHEAAAQVNDAFRDANVTKAVHDPKAAGFVYSFAGESRTHKFEHGHHSHEQRKDEVAKLRVSLVEELMSMPVAGPELEQSDESAKDPEAKA